MAILYVAPTGVGNADGSDWNNPLGSGFAPIRGNTYYLADGYYGTKTWNTANAGNTFITVNKATIANHGTTTGWSDSYGDGSSDFSTWGIDTSFWDINGQNGGGPSNWTSNFGIKVDSSSGILCYLSTSHSGINLNHISFSSNRGSTFIAGIKGTLGYCSGITVKNCAFTGIFGPIFHMNNWSDCTFEYLYCFANKSTAEDHAEGISSLGVNKNNTWRWSIWDKIEGTAIFAGVNFGTTSGWNIYGNIFSRSTTPLYYYWENPGTNQNNLLDTKLFNNTIYGCSGNSIGGFLAQQGTGNIAYNNLYYINDSNSFASSNIFHNYSFAYGNIRSEGGPFDKDPEILAGESNPQTGVANPFVNYNADPLLGNFSAITFNGLSTGIPDNATDMYGTARGQNGIWTRGAIQYRYLNLRRLGRRLKLKGLSPN